MQMEDHPLECAEFEGVMTSEEALDEGFLVFRLNSGQLHGVFVL